MTTQELASSKITKGNFKYITQSHVHVSPLLATADACRCGKNSAAENTCPNPKT